MVMIIQQSVNDLKPCVRLQQLVCFSVWKWKLLKELVQNWLLQFV